MNSRHRILATLAAAAFAFTVVAEAAPRKQSAPANGYAGRADVRACLVFYGAAMPRDFEVTEDQPESLDTLISRIQCPVLGVFGEADFLISLDDVRAFREALERHRKSYHIKIFAGMPHGWLNDTMPGRYRPKEAEEAWRLGIDFLERLDRARRHAVAAVHAAGVVEGGVLRQQHGVLALALHGEHALHLHLVAGLDAPGAEDALVVVDLDERVVLRDRPHLRLGDRAEPG